MNYQIINGNGKILPMIKGLEPFTFNTKVNCDGKEGGTYLLPDGKVLEVHIVFGWCYKGFLFESEKEWRNTKTEMPDAVKNEW